MTISAKQNNNHKPHMLLSFRRVKNFYTPVVHVNSTSTNVTSSLKYQVEESLKDLESELRERGKDYVLHLEQDDREVMRRWDVYLNGEHFATFDEDYAYDCFDISGTHFKDSIAALIELSEIEPLTELEREIYDAQIKAAKMIKHSKFSDRVNSLTKEEASLHKDLDRAFSRIKRM
ncbi:hypothetical protein [Anaerotardibacter muris]|uniref:hypothetical protein n=1 Tax=Anaerotardibacter muris TaxID=2941505 RepID=UPI00203ED88D|nr:hypothetical protein [Anaerotardibacter muris]